MNNLRYRAYRHSLGAVSITEEHISMRELHRMHDHVVLVAPKFVGVCSADIREIRGERPGRRDFGHEVVGTVLESTHGRHIAGDCVVLNPFVKVDRETAFSEVMYIAGSSEAISSALLHVREERLELIAVEPLACVIHAARQSRIDSVIPTLIFGAGFFGYLLYRYLEFKQVLVRLANRTPDRLRHLQAHAPDIAAVFHLDEYAECFASVFLMQSRLGPSDVSTAVHWLRDGGEIVLFGAVDATESTELYETRNRQQRRSYSKGEKTYSLQGTLDGSPADLQEAIRLLSIPQFRASLSAIFESPLTFEQGAAHLTQRARSPATYKKCVVHLQAP